MIAAFATLDRSERQRNLIDDAALLADDSGSDSPLIGYTILAFYGDGATRSAGYRPTPADHKIGSTMFEAWARGTLESHFTYGEGIRAATVVLNGDQ